MPIKPSQNRLNTWIISYSYKEDSELKVVTTEFEGTIKEAIFLEKQLRGLVRETPDAGFEIADTP